MQPGGILTAQDVPVKRFTTRRKAVEFYVDDDLFRGIPALPALHALELTKMHGVLKSSDGADKLDPILYVFSQFMEDESYKRFEARLSDKSNPIDLRTLMDVIQWILGEGYGLRPTQRPSPSGTGSIDSGTASTGGAPLSESTLLSSDGIAT